MSDMNQCEYMTVNFEVVPEGTITYFELFRNNRKVDEVVFPVNKYDVIKNFSFLSFLMVSEVLFHRSHFRNFGHLTVDGTKSFIPDWGVYFDALIKDTEGRTIH